MTALNSCLAISRRKTLRTFPGIALVGLSPLFALVLLCFCRADEAAPAAEGTRCRTHAEASGFYQKSPGETAVLELNGAEASGCGMAAGRSGEELGRQPPDSISTVARPGDTDQPGLGTEWRPAIECVGRGCFAQREPRAELAPLLLSGIRNDAHPNHEIRSMPISLIKLRAGNPAAARPVLWPSGGC